MLRPDRSGRRTVGWVPGIARLRVATDPTGRQPLPFWPATQQLRTLLGQHHALIFPRSTMARFRVSFHPSGDRHGHRPMITLESPPRPVRGMPQESIDHQERRQLGRQPRFEPDDITY